MKKTLKNPDIIDKAAQRGVFLWEIAEGLGIADSTFSRWLRRPVSDELREKILLMIDEIVSERGERHVSKLG